MPAARFGTVHAGWLGSRAYGIALAASGALVVISACRGAGGGEEPAGAPPDGAGPTGVRLSRGIAAGGTVSGRIALEAVAQDDSGTIARVDFLLTSPAEELACASGVARPAGQALSCTWNSTWVPNGAYSMKAVAYDAAGNSADSPAIDFTVANDPRPSSVLIDQALARGEIDAETALAYRVFAAFGDARLPARYQGNDGAAEDASLSRELLERFDGLSPGARATIAPFLLPPSAPGSWVELGLGEEGRLGAAAPALASALPAIEVRWRTVTTANDRVKVWWHEERTEDEAKARLIAGAVDFPIWPMLTELLGEPLSDAGLDAPGIANGGDGRIDIYLVHIGCIGWTKPYRIPNPTAAYILVDSRRRKLLQTTAHELVHAILYGYGRAFASGEYDWLDEATGTWAEDYVYPYDDSEHRWAASFLHAPEQALDSAPKLEWARAYLLPFYLHRAQGQGLIRSIWANTRGMHALDAIDAALPGGFEVTWPSFALYNWNREPVDYYSLWDDLPYSAWEIPVAARLDGEPDLALPQQEVKDLGLEHLSAWYYHYTFEDPGVRTVAFYNGLSFRLSRQANLIDPQLGPDVTAFVAEPLAPEERRGASVQALVKIGGGWQAPKDWTDKAGTVFCRDKVDERLEELVLIVSNGEHRRESATYLLKPQGDPPTLWLSNMGCWHWVGTADGSGGSGGLAFSSSAQVTWERFYDPDLCPGPDVPAGEPAPKVCYRPTAGTVAWKESVAGECTGGGSGVLPPGESGLLLTANFVTGGALHRSYRGEATTDDPSSYTLACPWGEVSAGQPVPWFRASVDPNLNPLQVTSTGELLEGTAPQVSGSATWTFAAVRD